MKASPNKESLARGLARALTWAAIFGAVALFWMGVAVALVAWLR